MWGKFRRGILVANADLFGSIYNYQDVLRSLVGNICQVYMQILGFNQKIQLLLENVAFQEKTVKIVETKQKLGQTSGLDVQQAKSVLETTRATLQMQILQKQLAENFLSTLLGVAPFHLEDCYNLRVPLPFPPKNPAVGIPIELVRTRPDIRRVEQAAIAQANIVGIAETELLPAFSLSGFFGWEAEDKGDLFTSQSKTTQFSQSFAWNILNYGRLTTNVRLQNAVLQERLVDYQNTVINACREVEDAIISYLQNRAILKDLGKAVEATARSLDLSMTQYEYGAIDSYSLTSFFFSKKLQWIKQQFLLEIPLNVWKLH